MSRGRRRQTTPPCKPAAQKGTELPAAAFVALSFTYFIILVIFGRAVTEARGALHAHSPLRRTVATRAHIATRGTCHT